MRTSALFRISACFLVFCSLSLHAQTVTTFEGIDASQLAKPELNVDENGAVGTKQYMEWTNVYFQAWSKTSPYTAVWTKPQVGTLPFTNNGLTQCSSIEGDGLVKFDQLASRWIIAAHNQLTSTITQYYYCVAISNTDDLTSSSLQWYTYAFPLDSILGTNAEGTYYFPDWPKLGVWIDAYYVGIDYQDINNGFQIDGVIACALDRTDMLVGAAALSPQCFKYPSTVNGVYLGHSLQPADVEGTTPPPTGSPEYFVSIENPVLDGVTTTSDTFNLFQFSVNWSNPAETTFTQSTVSAPAYTPGCYNPKSAANTVCVPEPSTSSTGQPIDSVGDRFEYRFAYRNFGTYQSYLVSHTVQVGTGSLSQTGIRWYEFRGSGVPSPYQWGTISPDNTNYRFMPSITQDQSANAAVGYSISSASLHPSISASYWNLNSDTSPTEISLYSGSADEENSYHWGTYTSMNVDPMNGCTFWYLNEYFSQNQTGSGTKPIWQTRVSNFTLPTCGGVAASPTSLTFSSQAVGTTSAPQQVILNNSQATALTINSIYGAGADPGDFNQTNDCGSSVAAGSSCTINVTFTPTASGSRTATLMISDGANNSPQQVTLTGTGTSGASVSLSRTSVNFGVQADGTTTAQSSIVVTNNGNATLTFTSIGVTGTNASNFPESTNCGSSLAQGNSCTIYVSFSPTTAGNYSAAVTLTDNAANSPQSAALAGTGIVPVTLSVSSLSFGVVQVGSSKTAAPVTLTNQMAVALTGVTVGVTGTGYSQVNTCGTSVPTGGTCTITISFTPKAAGTVAGTMTVTDSANNSPQTLSLSATGQLPVSATPATLAFGTVKVGTSSAAKNVTFTNNLKTNLTINSMTFTGTAAGDYSYTQTCGSIVSPQSKCTISITFSPAATGARPATLQISDSSTNSPQKVTLTGTGD